MKISVIIPVLNEEKTILKTLESVNAQHPHEVIVVDGGSQDQTVLVASKEARVLSSVKGRAEQMNAGARAASGDIFLFLHADTLLPEKGLTLIQEALQRGERGGRFCMRFDDRRWSLRLMELYTCLPCFSYGDQGFFAEAELFHELGGFSTVAALEDVDFYRRLRKKIKPVILPAEVITSARRFVGVGCWRQKWINLFLMGLYYAGIDMTKYKRKLYADVR